MESRRKPLIKGRIFYGWYILAACFFILFFNSGARYVIGVIFKPMIADFGWSRSAISFAYFLNMTFYALSLTIVGRFYDRYGPKWVIVVSTLLLFAGSLCVSMLQSFWQLLFFYGIIYGVGLGGPSLFLVSILTPKWFKRARGFGVSLGISGSCLGQFALVPLFTYLVLQFGWRVSCFWLGFIMLVVNVPLALWVIKGDPEDLGVKPFGTEEKEKAVALPKADAGRFDPEDMGPRQAMKTGSFWFLSIALFVCGSGDFLVTTHLIPMATDQGISPTSAGNMLGWFGLTSLLGILVAGPASDLIGSKIPIALTFFLRILLFLLIIQFQTAHSFYVFSLTFGFTFLITAPLTPILVGRLYGFSHMGMITGIMTTIHHFGGGLWAYVGGWLFDITGSYRAVFLLSALMALLAVICTLLVKEKRHRILVSN